MTLGFKRQFVPLVESGSKQHTRKAARLPERPILEADQI